MIITINGEPLKAEQILGANLEEILLGIQEQETNGRILGKVAVNGQEYNEDVPHAAVEVARSAIDTLELTTQSVEEIAIHFIKHSDSIVKSLLGALPKIVEMFRLADETEANEHFLNFLESLHLLMGMLDGAQQVLNLNLTENHGSEGSIQNIIEQFSNVMNDLIRIQEENDWIYLADILEYELADVLKAFNSVLPKLTAVKH